MSESFVIGTFAAYCVLFLGAVVCISLWKTKRSRRRSPMEFKLLREPGETLRRRMMAASENDSFKMGAAASVPIFLGSMISIAVLKFGPPTRLTPISALTAGIVIWIVAMVAAGRWLLRDIARWRDDRLGYLGEREVAEHLRPLLGRGYRVFHDMPAEGAKEMFNLDHVTIGPSGVAAIEVKTRRKGAARAGMKDYVVKYNGQALVWPWGEDREALAQAVNEAEWLRKFIRQRTGIDTPVRAILALPGWWVEEEGGGRVAVVNSKLIAKAVEGARQRILSDEQIDLIAHQIEERCRDVVD